MLDFDTAAGLDGQCLVGAGVERTLTYLASLGDTEIRGYIESMQKSGDLDDLQSWEAHRVR